MALNAITVYVETEEPLSNRELRRMASDTSDWLQAVGFQDHKDKNIKPEGAFAHGHIHVSTEDMACSTCVAIARDERK